MARAIRIIALLTTLLILLILPGGVGLASTRGLAPAAVQPADPILTAWIFNTDGHTNPHWPTTPVDVQSVTTTTVGGVPYAQVHTNSIANYYTAITQQLLQELNSRPHASTDFRLGHTTATEGQIVRFGDDIGYSTTRCFLGYWPPGPGCPTAQNRTFNFPMQPVRATSNTATSLGATGLWVDGTAVYNW